MTEVYSKDILTEERSARELKYTFEKPDMFYKTGFLVLENQCRNGFVPCVKILKNGKLQLIYDISHYKTFAEILPGMSPPSFRTVVSNLIKLTGEMQLIGFLQCENIFLSLDKIFIDTNNLSVFLLYLPIKSNEQDCLPLFEKKLRENILKVAKAFPNVADASTLKLLADYAQSGSERQNTKRKTVLRQRNSIIKKEIEINKNEFIIGKNKNQVDSVITDSTFISRVHCKVITSGDTFFVTDMHSANGTYLNGTRLVPEREYKLSNGDLITLANLEFVFCVEQGN